MNTNKNFKNQKNHKLYKGNKHQMSEPTPLMYPFQYFQDMMNHFQMVLNLEQSKRLDSTYVQNCQSMVKHYQSLLTLGQYHTVHIDEIHYFYFIMEECQNIMDENTKNMLELQAVFDAEMEAQLEADSLMF